MNNSGQLIDQDKCDMQQSSKSQPPLGSDSTSELSSILRDKLIVNEMISVRNRGFHDGYDEGKQKTMQKSLDAGYERAFERNFILSTLKGVATALKSSHNLKEQNGLTADHSRRRHHQNQRPNSANYPSPSTKINRNDSSSTHSSLAQIPPTKGSTASSSPKSTSTLSTSSYSTSSASSSPSTTSTSSSTSSKSKHHHHRHSTGQPNSRLLTQKYLGNTGRRSAISTKSNGNENPSNGGSDNATRRLSSGNVSGCGNFSSTHVVNVNISSNHMSLLESMKFDSTSDIESLKKDLIRICRENRLEILAHYVSQIG